MFEPQPIKISKRGKKPFLFLVALLWLLTVVVVAWSVCAQILSADVLLPKSYLSVKLSTEMQKAKEETRFDEMLGSKRFNEPNDPIKTSDPMTSVGSLEKLLEGETVVVPE